MARSVFWGCVWFGPIGKKIGHGREKEPGVAMRYMG